MCDATGDATGAAIATHRRARRRRVRRHAGTHALDLFLRLRCPRAARRTVGARQWDAMPQPFSIHEFVAALTKWPPLFTAAVCCECAMFGVPAALLIAQHRTRWLDRACGDERVQCLGGMKRSFLVFAAVLEGLWTTWSVLVFTFVLAELPSAPQFALHSSLRWGVGLSCVGLGLGVATLAFTILGTARSCCLNFFEPDVPVETHWVFRIFHEPEEYGFLFAVWGGVLVSQSYHLLWMAGFTTLAMLCWQQLENLPVSEARRRGQGTTALHGRLLA